MCVCVFAAAVLCVCVHACDCIYLCVFAAAVLCVCVCTCVCCIQTENLQFFLSVDQDLLHLISRLFQPRFLFCVRYMFKNQ